MKSKESITEQLKNPDKAYAVLRKMAEEVASLREQVKTLEVKLKAVGGELEITHAKADKIRSLFIFRNSSTGKGLTDSQIIERVFDLKRSRSDTYKTAKALVEELRRQYEDDREKRLQEANKRLREKRTA